MVRNQGKRVWELAPGQIAELDDARGTALRVTRGVLWVTMERDPRDVVLGAGDAFVVSRNGVTLMEATGRTRVRVHAPHVGGMADGPAALVGYCEDALRGLMRAPGRLIRKWTATLADLVRRAY